MRVREQMSTEVVSVTPQTPLAEARTLLTERGLRCLPVVTDGQLVSLLLASDPRLRNAPGGAQVSDYLSPPSASVRPDMLIERAALLMLEHDVRGLPVTDAHGRLLGVLTVRDLLRTLVEAPPVVLWR